MLPGVKIALLTLVSLGALACAGAMVCFSRPMWLFYHYELRTANQMITRVEAFQGSHRRLPEMMDEVGFEDPRDKVFYVKVSDDEYCLSFGTELGESETYWSHKKEWEEGRECVPQR